MVWHAYAPFPPPFSTLTIILPSFFLQLTHPPLTHSLSLVLIAGKHASSENPAAYLQLYSL